MTECPVCGSELEFLHEGSTEGALCRRCGWSVVTTSIPEIDADESTYCVYVTGANSRDLDQVRASASIAGVNFIEARKLLAEETPLLFQGSARQVAEIKKVLDGVGMQYQIVPEFRY
jgi:hypothetical protein